MKNIYFKLMFVVIILLSIMLNVSGASGQSIDGKDLIGIWIQKIHNSGITTSHHYQLISKGGSSVKLEYLKTTSSEPMSQSEALLREIELSVSSGGGLQGTATYYMKRIWRLGPPKTTDISGSVSSNGRRITLQGKTPGFGGRPGNFSWNGSYKDTITILERY